MTRFAFLVCGLSLSAWAVVGLCADEAGEYPVPLMDGKPFLHVVHDGRSIRVERIQDPEFELRGYYAKTARKCPPFCIHAMQVTPGVATVGEVEMFEFMETQMRDGTGVLIDARTPEWYKKGTIPGSVSFPFTEFTKPPADPAWDQLFPSFGAKLAQEPGLMQQTLESFGLGEQKLQAGKWDFADAKDLVIFCNGPACDQSPRAITGLVAAGYPAQKLFYYRGGMQMWELWGLTTVTPQEQ